MSAPEPPSDAEIAELRAAVDRLEREVRDLRDMLGQVWQRVFPPMAGPPDEADAIEPGEPWDLKPPGGQP